MNDEIFIIDDFLCDRRYIGVGKKELSDILVKIVKIKLDDEYFPDYSNSHPPEKPDFTEEDLDKFPEFVRKKSKSKLKMYNDDLRAFEYQQQIYLDAKKSVETNDGLLAYKVLERSDTTHREQTFKIEVKDKDNVTRSFDVRQYFETGLIHKLFLKMECVKPLESCGCVSLLNNKNIGIHPKYPK